MNAYTLGDTVLVYLAIVACVAMAAAIKRMDGE